MSGVSYLEVVGVSSVGFSAVTSNGQFRPGYLSIYLSTWCSVSVSVSVSRFRMFVRFDFFDF